MNEFTKTELVGCLITMIKEIAPESVLVKKYGGIIFQKAQGNPTTQFCGVFEYQQHVSLEFSNGFQLDDPRKLLQGNGEKRRHIKLFELCDIEKNCCADFILQAYNF